MMPSNAATRVALANRVGFKDHKGIRNGLVCMGSTAAITAKGSYASSFCFALPVHWASNGFAARVADFR
jgi:hypothetical protein